MDNLPNIIESLASGTEESLLTLKSHLETHENTNWPALSQLEPLIFEFSLKSELLMLAGVYVLSQICINHSQVSTIQTLKHLYTSNTPKLKLEIIRALIAIKQTQSGLSSAICKNFKILEIISVVGFEEAVELIDIYAQRYLGIEEGQIIVKNLSRMIIRSNDLRCLKTMTLVLEYNAFLSQFISSEFLRFVLERVGNDDLEFREKGVRVIGTFVENTEQAFVELVPLRVFDYLLPLIYTNEKLNVLLIFSNIVGEDESVVEIMILNKGFEEIFYMLNKTGDPRVYREVVFVVHNASIVANKQQVQYFTRIGVVEMMKNLEELLDDEIRRVIFRTFKNFQKYFPNLKF